MMDWKECNLNRFVKEIKIDKNLISSLIKSSENKLKVSNLLVLNDTTASVKFTIIYDSLREILEAIAIKKGYKIYNHECFTSFLFEILNEEITSKDFDRLRIIRNGINYYGNSIISQESEILMKKAIKLRENLLAKYLK